jgi:glycosyltransferase involved in cell wall biosynthesis
MREQRHRILCIANCRIADMLAKGNVWYVRHFEAHFDRVFVVYEFGRSPRFLVRGRTALVSLGTGLGTFCDLLWSPVSLYRVVRRLDPSVVLTGDQVFSFWALSLVRLLLRRKVALIPVCIPDEIHRSTGRGTTGLPIWLENLFIALTRRTIDLVISQRSADVRPWIESKAGFRNIIRVDTWPDALPSSSFLAAAEALKPGTRSSGGGAFRMIFVGRLHAEKHVEDLLHMMRDLRDLPGATLTIVGDGPRRAELERLSAELGVARSVEFAGAVPNDRLPALYAGAALYVSTVTGTSLREAALCGLPIVSYAIPWVANTFSDGVNALIVPFGDHRALAAAVRRLMRDEALRLALVKGAGALARELWSTERLAPALAAVEEALS